MVTSRKKPGKPVCGAKTRRGTSCQCKPLKPNGRCKFHGGLSTGPKTEDGKEAARRNLEKARATLAGPEHVAARRERSLKGWETRRRQAKKARLLDAARISGFSPSLLALLERNL